MTFKKNCSLFLPPSRLAFTLLLIFAVGSTASCLHAQTTKSSGTTSPASAHSQATSAAPDLDALRKAIGQGHASDALQQLDLAAQSNPVPNGVQRLRGVALYSQGKLQEAEKAFAEAIIQDPADRESIQMRGLTLFRLGRPDAAIPLLERARKDNEVAENHPNTPADPAYVLALCYLDTRRYDDARGAFALQFGFPPDSAPAYLLAARMLLRREYVPIAQQFAKKALEIQPRLPQAHLLLGEAALAGNHLDEAVKEFEQERELNPLEPSIYDRLGDAYIRQGTYDRAKLSLQEAILLEPNFTGPFILLGKVLLKQGDATGAATFLQHARTMDNQNYMAHSLLGQAYRQMGLVDEARKETDIAQKLQSASEPKLENIK
jgi:tetratricopeptide (TPR) repeat protein